MCNKCKVVREYFVDDTDIYNKFAIIQNKIVSTENLFYSYMNDQFDFFNGQKLNDIITVYSDFKMQEKLLILHCLERFISPSEANLFCFNDIYCAKFDCYDKTIRIHLKENSEVAS